MLVRVYFFMNIFRFPWKYFSPFQRLEKNKKKSICACLMVQNCLKSQAFINPITVHALVEHLSHWFPFLRSKMWFNTNKLYRHFAFEWWNHAAASFSCFFCSFVSPNEGDERRIEGCVCVTIIMEEDSTYEKYGVVYSPNPRKLNEINGDIVCSFLNAKDTLFVRSMFSGLCLHVATNMALVSTRGYCKVVWIWTISAVQWLLFFLPVLLCVCVNRNTKCQRPKKI